MKTYLDYKFPQVSLRAKERGGRKEGEEGTKGRDERGWGGEKTEHCLYYLTMTGQQKIPQFSTKVQAYTDGSTCALDSIPSTKNQRR